MLDFMQAKTVELFFGSGSNMGDMLESTPGYRYFTMSTLRQYKSGAQWIGR